MSSSSIALTNLNPRIISTLNLIKLENNFTRVIPITIGNSKNLKFLDLSENQIAGAIPESMGLLPELQLLYLNGNQLSGDISSSIDGLESIQFFRLSENKVTGNIPPTIGKLKKIQRLIFENNKLTGKLPATSQLARLQNLQTLDLSYNPLNMITSPTWFSKLKLFRLKLAGTRIQGPLPGFLSSLSTISELDLSSNSLTGELPNWIGNMTNQVIICDT